MASKVTCFAKYRVVRKVSFVLRGNNVVVKHASVKERHFSDKLIVSFVRPTNGGGLLSQMADISKGGLRKVESSRTRRYEESARNFEFEWQVVRAGVCSFFSGKFALVSRSGVSCLIVKGLIVNKIDNTCGENKALVGNT